ncbi:hypothetical protein GOBAR_AA00543 [Gossypium barbadense]|uniref:Aminotransferase class IV n=1 Tax=Gossypium barbadense TaxID=3634 RepID=A0A2P5YWQ0_GOSBA|nr:hypothetical protein GOBAR_AA00543 [Gossypium barbadense]
MDSMRFLYSKGVLSCSSDAPPITTFLESLPGSYTTTRTHENGTTLLFWERHLKRLSNSTRILLNSNPELIFKTNKKSPLLFSPFPVTGLKWESRIRSLVSNSLSQVLPIALKERSKGEELAVTALVSGDIEKLKAMKNVGGGGSYIPPVFGIEESGAHLALVGHGRDLADAKYSDWVRLRKPLEKLRPPSVTELLLSNDGDRILEGCITNFFVICQRSDLDVRVNYKYMSNMGMHNFSQNFYVYRIEISMPDMSEAEGKYLDGYNNVYSVEVQTAPVSDGVLPGVIRELVIVCHSKGIPVCEVAPSWEKHRLWEEAFVTTLYMQMHVSNSLWYMDLLGSLIFLSKVWELYLHKCVLDPDSLRVLQHVETIKVPQPWESLKSKCFEGISWIEKKFEGPGIITKVIQCRKRSWREPARKATH